MSCESSTLKTQDSKLHGYQRRSRWLISLLQEGCSSDFREVLGSPGGSGETIVREQDDPADAETAGRLHIRDDLDRRQLVGSNPGPERMPSRDRARGRDLRDEGRGVGR